MSKKLNPTLTKTSSGKMYLEDSTETKYLLNPDILSSSQNAIKSTQSSKKYNYLFKLVTVRKLLEYPVEELIAKLEAEKLAIEKQAIRTNGSVPYPTPTEVKDPQNVYGVFIDEDIRGLTAPVHVFFSPSNEVRCYVESTGKDKDDWIVTIAYELERLENPDTTKRVKWRLVTVDNSLGSRLLYVLDSISLPVGFEDNYSIRSLEYLGGATWGGLAVDPLLKKPVTAIVDNSLVDKYIPIGQSNSPIKPRRTKCIVYHSFTPSHAFNWHKQTLQTTIAANYFNQLLDKVAYKTEGHIRVYRKHTYSLKLPIRSAQGEDIKEIAKTEYSNGEATYVGNTNSPINSIYQSPDYGTDFERLSIATYTISTNVARNTDKDTLRNYSQVNSFKSVNSFNVVSSSYNNHYKMILDIGEGRGSINHPYELKTTAGKRGYDYPDFFKYWYTYGQVVNVSPILPAKRFRLNSVTGNPTEIGDMLDLGDIGIDSEEANRIITTWDSLPNPQTGYFGIVTGELNFIIQYVNPPLIGHDGVYYYNKQPKNIALAGGLFDRSFGSDVAIATANSGFGGTFVSGGSRESDSRDRANSTLIAYSKLLGALGGGAVKSLNIGFVNIAANDGESVAVRSPTPEMKAELKNVPHLFPSGFWDSDLQDIEIKAGVGTSIVYRTDLEIQSTTNF